MSSVLSMRLKVLGGWVCGVVGRKAWVRVGSSPCQRVHCMPYLAASSLSSVLT
jgi:hypothetical protein